MIFRKIILPITCLIAILASLTLPIYLLVLTIKFMESIPMGICVANFILCITAICVFPLVYIFTAIDKRYGG